MIGLKNRILWLDVFIVELIAEQSYSFKNGLFDCINFEWLPLQTLVPCIRSLSEVHHEFIFNVFYSSCGFLFQCFFLFFFHENTRFCMDTSLSLVISSVKLRKKLLQKRANTFDLDIYEPVWRFYSKITVNINTVSEKVESIMPMFKIYLSMCLIRFIKKDWNYPNPPDLVYF